MGVCQGVRFVVLLSREVLKGLQSVRSGGLKASGDVKDVSDRGLKFGNFMRQVGKDAGGVVGDFYQQGSLNQRDMLLLLADPLN